MKSIAKVSCLCLALGYGFSYTHAATARVATAQQDNTRVQYTSNRPQERLFVSNAVEEQIKRVKSLLTNARLAWMFENCFPNTLDTTVHFDGDDDTFVYTGDIHAMWLRDSGAQVWPYVQLANQDPRLKKMLAGVINRQFKCINIDPYANAFNMGPTGGEWMSDMTDMKPELHERKWEIDSLCYPLRLAYQYWKVTGDSSIFDGEWMKAITAILKTFKEQQRKDAMLSELAVGDTVLTTSGFYGVVIDISDDTVIIEFGNNKNCRIPMQRAAIAAVEKPEEAVVDKTDKKADKKDKKAEK